MVTCEKEKGILSLRKGGQEQLYNGPNKPLPELYVTRTQFHL